MGLFGILLIAGITFSLCWLIDKGFTKAFRSKPQHESGMSVRLNKHIGGTGIALIVLGILGLIAGQGWLLAAAGGILVVVGGFLVTYYMTFGVYYDEESFLFTGLGKRSATYRFEAIRGQQLYISGGKAIIELHMQDGNTVQLQPGMSGVYAFLDKSFAGWCAQKGFTKEDCPHYDPENSCWFPALED